MNVNRWGLDSHLVAWVAVPLDDDARRRAAETKRERTRRKIIDGVAQVMSRDSSTVSDISYSSVAEVSGVSEATIYRYFPTLSELRGAQLNELVTKLETSDDLRTLFSELVFYARYLLTEQEMEQTTSFIRQHLKGNPGERPVIAELALRAFLRLGEPREQS